MVDDASAEQLIRVSWLYYEQDLNQEEIAQRLGVSRSTVSRLLKEARRAGVVQISATPPSEATRLADDLVGRWGLFHAAVEPSSTLDSAEMGAARAAARFLSGLARSPGTLGVGWGTTLHVAAELVQRGADPNRTIVEIVGRPQGGDGKMVAVSGVLAHKWGTVTIPVPAPAFVRSDRVARELRQDPVVRVALERARAAEVIVVGVGSTDKNATLIREGIMTPREMADIREAGAVGDLLGQFFDAFGQPVKKVQPIEVVGLALKELANHGRVVAVAGGPGKVAALSGAIEGGLIQGVITDQLTAEALLTHE